MAEWPNALVLKTSVLRGTQGSNPCLSAIIHPVKSQSFSNEGLEQQQIIFVGRPREEGDSLHAATKSFFVLIMFNGSLFPNIVGADKLPNRIVWRGGRVAECGSLLSC